MSLPKDHLSKIYLIFPLALAAVLSGKASAENYVWKSGYTTNLYSTSDSYPTPDQACQATTRKWGYGMYLDLPPIRKSDKDFQCRWVDKVSGVEVRNFYNSWRLGTGCDGIYDNLTGQCLPSEEEKCECDTFNVIGNSIDPVTGLNTQRESDFDFGNGIKAERYYNSYDDKWRHAYSSELINKGSTMLLVRPNGKASAFLVIDGIAYGQGAEKGRLISTSSGWDYVGLGNDRSYFDATGKIVGFQPPGKLRYDVTRVGQNLNVIDPYSGGQITIEQDDRGQPKKIIGAAATITYQYDNKNALVKATTLAQGQVKERKYFYENTASKSMLTKIVDENSNEVARFSYVNRRVASAVYGGVRESVFSYSGNGTRIKNELGKYTNFKTAISNGVNRVVAIEGEPTLNCPATTSSCQYDSRGLLRSRTDNMGRTTTYEHDEYGFEISRTDAAGTSLAQTTTTEWHPTLPLPVKITGSGRTTTYQYDSEGRRVSQTISED